MQETKKIILVVDNEPDICTYLCTLFEDHGYKTMQARRADEAIKIIENYTPDLICLDIMMPGQSGIELYRKINLLDEYSHIPAIFISAFSMAQDFKGQRFRKLIPEKQVPKPAAFLEKPIDPTRLIETVKQIVG